ncbi:hypothetical protein AB6A40_010841 [Gnathostoma spinigerum]|uniref:Secreted protein n=1 Tax=Gnathostoma spinigerum TaxID=75299 RepID=A0ABD6EYG9_9BILA
MFAFKFLLHPLQIRVTCQQCAQYSLFSAFRCNSPSSFYRLFVFRRTDRRSDKNVYRKKTVTSTEQKG